MRAIRLVLVGAIAILATPRAWGEEGGRGGKDRLVMFARPPSAEEVSVAIEDLGEAREIQYRSEAMTAGYTLAPGESVESAVGRMAAKQREFLEAAIEEVRTAQKERGEEVEDRGHGTLEANFRAALGELDRGEFGIRAVRVEETGARRALRGKRSDTGKNTPLGQTREAWAPSRGTAIVTRTAAFNTFYFDSVKGFGANTSYSHRVEIYNPAFANYGYYWASNMPEAFLELSFGSTADVFSVGTTAPRAFRRNFEYFTHVALVGGGSSTATPIVRIRGLLGRTAEGCHGWASCVVSSLAITRDFAVFQAPVVGWTFSWSY